MKIASLVAATLLTFVSGQETALGHDANEEKPQSRGLQVDEGLFVSNIRSDVPWCLTAKEKSNDVFVGFAKCTPIATPFIVGGESTQEWLVEDSGRIRSSAFPDLCMTVATGRNGNVRGGDRIKLRDCDGAGEVNTFIYDADDTGPIFVEDFDSFCLTNTGNAPQTTDTIRARRCQDIAQFQFTFEDISEFGTPDSINPELGGEYNYLVSNIIFPRNSNWCITRRRRLIGRDEAVLARCFFDEVATPFANFDEADQRWRVERDGLIRSDADGGLCLAVDFINDRLGGARIVLDDCDDLLLDFNRFTFDGGTGPIGVFPTDGRLCLTNRGSTANRGDPILVERCRDAPKFLFTYED